MSTLLDQTVPQLRAICDRLCEESGRNLFPQLNSKSTKPEIAAAIFSYTGVASLPADEASCAVSKEYKTLSSGELRMCPANARFEAELWDVGIQNSLKQSGQIGPLTVTLASHLDPEAPEGLYDVIAGNRTFYNMMHLWGQDDDFPVEVTVMTFRGLPQEVESQIIDTLTMENGTHLPFTAIGLLDIYARKKRAGWKNIDIAKRYGKSSSHVTEILKLSLLPDYIRKLVHYAALEDHLSKHPQNVLVEQNVPFRVVEVDGHSVVKIEGIIYNNAIEMVKIFPKKPAVSNFPDRDAYENALVEWEQQCMDVQELLMRDDVLTAAKTLSRASFQGALEQACVKAGLGFLVQDVTIEQPAKKSGDNPKQSSSDEVVETLEDARARLLDDTAPAEKKETAQKETVERPRFDPKKYDEHQIRMLTILHDTPDAFAQGFIDGAYEIYEKALMTGLKDAAKNRPDLLRKFFHALIDMDAIFVSDERDEEAAE